MTLSHSELTFDADIFVFETVMRVRQAEVGVSQHLSLEALTAQLTEARARFFFAKGIQDVETSHQGLVVDHAQLSIKSIVRVRETLMFEVGVAQWCDNGGSIAIKVTRMLDGTLVAMAHQHLINYEYRLHKAVPLGHCTKEALEGLTLPS